MLTLTTMARAGVTIRGGVTWPSVYTHRTWLLAIKRSMLGVLPLPGNSIAAGRLPGTCKVGFIRAGRRDDLRVQYNTPHGRADRIAEFTEVAVFLRRLEKATG
jgi:hypothetical protein